MKVLFLTLVKIDDIECYGIYSDLLRKFRNEGHDVTIVCPNERKHNGRTSLLKKNGVSILPKLVALLEDLKVEYLTLCYLFLLVNFFQY
jgi:hypothetical protein